MSIYSGEISSGATTPADEEDVTRQEEEQEAYQRLRDLEKRYGVSKPKPRLSFYYVLQTSP